MESLASRFSQAVKLDLEGLQNDEKDNWDQY